jgi:DNA-binding ferritin-like protein
MSTTECYIENVREGLATLCQHFRIGIDRSTAFNDVGTADLLTECIRETEKVLWFVEAHQQEE